VGPLRIKVLRYGQPVAIADFREVDGGYLAWKFLSEGRLEWYLQLTEDDVVHKTRALLIAETGTRFVVTFVGEADPALEQSTMFVEVNGPIRIGTIEASISWGGVIDLPKEQFTLRVEDIT